MQLFYFSCSPLIGLLQFYLFGDQHALPLILNSYYLVINWILPDIMQISIGYLIKIFADLQ